MQTEEPIPTRRSLLERIRDPLDHSSWDEFHRVYHGLLRGVALRAGLNEHEAEEAAQETFIVVAAKMPEFRYQSGKDSFKGWLLQVVRWKVLDQLRKRRIQASRVCPIELAVGEDAPGVVEVADAGQDFDAHWEVEWERHLLVQALDRVKRRAQPEHYSMYHLHVLEQHPVKEVCRTLGVSAAAVYLAKHRVGSLVRDEVKRLRQLLSLE